MPGSAERFPCKTLLEGAGSFRDSGSAGFKRAGLIPYPGSSKSSSLGHLGDKPTGFVGRRFPLGKTCSCLSPGASPTGFHPSLTCLLDSTGRSHGSQHSWLWTQSSGSPLPHPLHGTTPTDPVTRSEPPGASCVDSMGPLVRSLTSTHSLDPSDEQSPNNSTKHPVARTAEPPSIGPQNQNLNLVPWKSRGGADE